MRKVGKITSRKEKVILSDLLDLAFELVYNKPKALEIKLGETTKHRLT